MKRYCIKHRRKYKREQLDKICPGCTYIVCDLHREYPSEEGEGLNLNVIERAEIARRFKEMVDKKSEEGDL